MDKVSIIVPVFNTEKYLKECIESIINQTYQNIEIVMIDDGSSDNSSIICDQYAKKDSRIIVVHKQNEGVSVSRNLGLKIATGKYIMFVDIDDYIDRNFVAKMISNIKSDEMVICGYNYIYKNKIKNVSSAKILKINKNILNVIFKYSFIGGFCTNKLYFKDIIDVYNIKFDSRFKFCEDLYFNLQYLLHIKSVTILNAALYEYRMRKSSATWKLDTSIINNLQSCVNHIDYFLTKRKSNTIEFVYFKTEMLLKYISYKKNPELFDDYKLLMKSQGILLRQKIKLYILKRYNFIYKFYMKIKLKIVRLFD